MLLLLLLLPGWVPGSLLTHSTTFQTALGYPRPAPGSANLGVCAKAVADRYGCLALTLEMPFKDAACEWGQQEGVLGAPRV
jgi:hypothetical protein